VSLRVLIVDDEPLARARLRELLAAQPDLVVAGEAADGDSAIAACQRGPVDLVLLDIRMPGRDGVDTAAQLALLQPPPAVVFLTAGDDRALEAFETGAVDYLLKPVRGERLAQALARARRLRAGPADAGPGTGGARRQFVVRRAGGLRLVPVEDVRCLRAEDKYVCLLTGDGEFLIEESLAAIEREFGDRFIRIHRNCLVAAAHLRGLERAGDGSERVRIDGLRETLEVSRRNLPALRARLLRDATG
jgi:two-component system response regulator AlgR